MTNAEALQFLHRMQRNLLLVDQGLNILTLKETSEMLDITISKIIQDLDTATNAVAARLQKLIDAAKAAGSLSVAEVVAALQPEVDRLTALGKDPSDPVPAV